MSICSRISGCIVAIIMIPVCILAGIAVAISAPFYALCGYDTNISYELVNNFG